MFDFFKSKKADVIDHWYALIPSFNTSTKDFYETIEKELEDREVPGLEVFHVDFAEGGVLSAKREYLRMTRERLVFDICAAPFGKAFFFSCRFAEIPAAIQLWQVLVILAAFAVCVPLSFLICAKIFGTLALFVWPLGWIVLLALAIYVMRNAVAMGLRDLDASLIKSPVLGPIYENWFRKVEAALLASLWGEAVVPLKSSSFAITETPRVDESPKAAMPPVMEIQKATVLEKKMEAKLADTAAPKDLGRGGARHKAIQNRVKTEAQKLGFFVEVEKQLASGSNDAADLVLRRGQVEIAVEISITTGVDHEFENIKKCLAASFARVAVIATGRRQLESIADAVQGGLGSVAAAKVGYYTPDEFLAELQKLANTAEAPPASEPMARISKALGFEITRNFPKQSPEEQRLTQQAIHEVTQKALKS